MFKLTDLPPKNLEGVQVEIIKNKEELIERLGLVDLDEIAENKAYVVREGGKPKILLHVGDIQEAASNLGSVAKTFKRVIVDLKEIDDVYKFINFTLLTYWDFDKYKSKRPEREIIFSTHGLDERSKKEAERAKAHAEAQMKAREWATEPPNVLNPSTFPNMIRELIKDLPIEMVVLEEEDLKKEGMELILAVGAGSEHRPKLVILEYKGGGKRVVLVGKGVTFDAGGYNLKPWEYMKNMHADMSGAAAVIAATIWAAKLGLGVDVVTLAPLVENLISGKAYKLEDIIRSYSGKYVHVSHTDAEGRLILADALAYAKRFSPELTVTLATLTGAQIVALGHDMAALYATNDEYARLIEEASKETGELVWRMPLYEKYKKRYLRSRVADINNIANVRTAGSIIGALFLSEFAPRPWVYLDIAGPAMAHEGNVDWASPYPTGWGTRLTLRALERFSQR